MGFQSIGLKFLQIYISIYATDNLQLATLDLSSASSFALTILALRRTEIMSESILSLKATKNFGTNQEISNLFNITLQCLDLMEEVGKIAFSAAELAHPQVMFSFFRIELFRTMGCELRGVVSRSTNSISYGVWWIKSAFPSNLVLAHS